MPADVPYFVDTNIWLYALLDTGAPGKARVARELVQANEAVLSSQVVNEVCVNLLKKTKIAEADIQRLIGSFYAK